MLCYIVPYKILFGKEVPMESAEWGKMAVFLYAAAITHLLGDLLGHWMEKNERTSLLVLHCFIYTLFFIPLFAWLKISFWWLLVPFISHLLIDSQWGAWRSLVNFILKKEEETTLVIITLGIDQVLHLAALFIIALFIFS